MKIENLIIGGGLAGTTIAIHLLPYNKDFLLIESSPRLGGKVETKVTPEACYEFGPNSFTNQTPEIFQLIEALDLTPSLLPASPAAKKRYILKNLKIVRLPSSPPEIVTTKTLSWAGKIRFLSEFFHVPSKVKNEETVWDFFSRHFGKEIADYFADPFVSGIFAGDAKKLSLREAFPTMEKAETKSSSLIRYLLAEKKTKKTSPQSFQLQGGLESIFHRARKQIGPDHLRFSEKIVEIVPGGVNRVITDQEEYEAGRLYLTVPAFVGAKLFKKHLPDLAVFLDQVSYAPVISAHLRIPRDETFSFDGFGILLPSSEKRSVLGALWNSSAFPELFPDKNHHYLTVYAGGVRQTDLIQQEEDKIRDLICREIQKLFALKKAPEWIQMRRHLQAIPQYNLGYGQILSGLRKNLPPSIRLAGNYLGGISMAQTVAYAAQQIELI